MKKRLDKHQNIVYNDRCGRLRVVDLYNPTHTDKERPAKLVWGFMVEEERDKGMAEERWRAIPDYEGKYDVSDMGRARRVRKTNGILSFRMLKPSCMGKNNSSVVSLSVDGIAKAFSLKDLVVAAFLPDVKDKHLIEHANGDRRDNRLSNLQLNEIEINESEKWRPIVDYEGWYEISDFGNVKRVRGGTNTFVGRILKQSLDGDGYHKVSLSKDGEKCNEKVHKLVMISFIGPRPKGKQINHKDGNKDNNHLDNLEYVTQSENMKHAYDTGLESQQGEKNAYSKLTEDNVHEIRQCHGHESQKSMAERFNVAPGTISNVVRGQNWSYLEEEDDDERT